MGIISSCSPDRAYGKKVSSKASEPAGILDEYQCFMTGDMIPSPQGLKTPAMNNIVR